MKLFNLFVGAITLISTCFAAPVSSNVKWAGFNYSLSGVKNSFGIVPSDSDVTGYVNSMKNRINKDAKPTLLLTVGTYSNDKCVFGFNQPKNTANLSNVRFNSQDKFSSILNQCDKKGINVWLVVEPGNNKLTDLAKIVLDQYGNHKSVQGFGVDLEWWNRNSNSNGTKLSNAEAEKVVTYIQGRNRNYTLVVKHWDASFMPKNYTNSIILVNTSQSFTSRNNMINIFNSWAKTFNNNKVMFEIGFKSDKTIWKNDPIGVAKSIVSSVSQYNKQIGIIWTEFTMKDLVNTL
ncbi:hypothetical protein PIROE2DRAFT_10595 [Piromyces sp. E2]|nr:hypothetical protein PIROE2DRAFT_10595 [Piromyces sp. E2]|eukprot:OUM62967.1 hypothetical protein PIROE2DRAFT_10595 [Piromyces sp. E2]